MRRETELSKNALAMVIVLAVIVIVVIGVMAYNAITSSRVESTSTQVTASTTPVEKTTITTTTSTRAETTTSVQGVVIMDSNGKQVLLHQLAKRIVVASPSIAEILYAIGFKGEIISLNNSIVLNEYLPSNLSTETVSDNNVSQILSFSPDLVVLDKNSNVPSLGDEFVGELEKNGVPVIVLSTNSLNDLFKSIEVLGKATGSGAGAEKLRTYLVEKYSSVKALSSKIVGDKKLSVVVVDGSSILNNDNGLAVYANTLWGRLVEDAGAVNIALKENPSKRTVNIGFNVLREWDPDAIIIIASINDANKVLNAIEHDEKWHSLRAYTSNRIYVVPFGLRIGDTLYPGPRTIIGLEYIASLLYPDVYTGIDWRQDMEYLLKNFYDVFIPKQAFASYSIKWKEIVDTLNETVKIPREPKRIVDFISYVTMTAFKAFDRIAGVSKYAKKNPLVTAAYPNITSKPSPGNSFSVNIEELSALNPDLVIIWPYKKDIIEEIESIGIPVVKVKLYSINDIYRLIWMTGSILDERERARTLVDSMNSLISFVRKRVAEIPAESRMRVLYLWSKPTKVQGGRGTVNDFIELAGGVNVAARDLPDKTYVEVDLEDIVKWNPDVIVLWYYARYNVSAILDDPVLQGVKAVVDKRVYCEPYYEHWGVDCSLFILWLAWKLYPEKFSDIDFYSIADKYYEEWYGVKYSAITGAGK